MGKTIRHIPEFFIIIHLQTLLIIMIGYFKNSLFQLFNRLADSTGQPIKQYQSCLLYTSQLAQSSVDFSPNLILAKATRESEKLTFGFKEDFLQYDLRVSMPGCVALTSSDNDYGFQYTPILEKMCIRDRRVCL